MGWIILGPIIAVLAILVVLTIVVNTLVAIESFKDWLDRTGGRR